MLPTGRLRVMTADSVAVMKTGETIKKTKQSCRHTYPVDNRGASIFVLLASGSVYAARQPCTVLYMSTEFNVDNLVSPFSFLNTHTHTQ